MNRSSFVSRCFSCAFAVTAFLGLSAAPAASDDNLRVIASVKPVHSLVSAVMAGVGEPQLIIRGNASPHTYITRPSDAVALEEADLIFMVGERLETSFAELVDVLAGQARVVRLLDAPGLVYKSVRAGGAFEDHDHHDHGHGHEDDGHGHEDDGHGHEDDGHGHEDDGHGHEDDGHGHEDDGHGHEDDGHGHEDDGHGHEDDGHGHEDDGHGHEDDGHGHEDDGHGHENDGHGHEDDGHGHEDDGHGHEDDGHGHEDDGHVDLEEGPVDVHVWLDPVNGGALAREIARVLSEVDPANAAAYAANADALIHRLDDLTADIARQLSPVRGVPFLVFHDAYRYFEDRFGLAAVGSVVVSPGRVPGARRISELRDKVHDLGVVCVFDEPQFDRRIVDTVIEGADVKAGTLDPLGANIEDGTELYFTLLTNMTETFGACLGATN